MKHQNWIDIAKGIGILCVAAGHVWPAGPGYNVIYLFHMPLFFLLSGILFYPRFDRIGFLARKAIHLLVPYFAYLIILFIPRFVHGALAIATHASVMLDTLSIMLRGGDALKGTAGIFWFITCLFLTQQIVNLILTLPLGRWTIGLIFFLMIVLGYLNNLFLPHWQLPWAANVVLVAAPIFYLGYLLRDHPLDRKAYAAAMLIALAAVAAVFFGAPLAIDMKSADYGIPILSLAAALCCCLSVFQIARGLERFRLIGPLLGGLGSMSMTIMFLHLPLLILLQDYFHLGNQIILFVAIVALSCAAHWIFNRLSWTRAIFLGSEADFRHLFRRSQPALE